MYLKAFGMDYTSTVPHGGTFIYLYAYIYPLDEILMLVQKSNVLRGEIPMISVHP
jgi:hypothetical protein